MISKELAKMGLTGSTAAILMLAPSILTGAFADNPHFIGTPSCSIVNGNLECTGRVAGLGNVSTVSAFLKATVTCTNQGENTPAGQVKSPQETLAVQNGQTGFDLTVPNPCHDHMTAKFTNVALVIGGTTLPIPGTFP